LKSKNYPRGEFVDTIFLGAASPTWRAIEYGFDLLKKGIVWRVRSGTKIQIWRDPWIPRPSSLKLNLKKTRTQLRWVSQLMKAVRREWDEGLIRSCLYPHDVEEVLKIRLSNWNEEDFIAWHYEKSGMFSVRSACKASFATATIRAKAGGQ
jgi:hypothetical protein